MLREERTAAGWADPGTLTAEREQAMLVDLVVGVLVLALLIYRQMRTRQVRSVDLRVPLIIAIIGVVQLADFLRTDHSRGAVAAGLAGSLALAAIFGAARASTVRLWLADGQAWARGTWLTGLLWAVSLAAHLGYDALVAGGDGKGSLGSASVLLYLAVTFTVQRFVVMYRSQRLGLANGPMSGRDAVV
jgi:hypothetical protein